jgi:hypothetical protein
MTNGNGKPKTVAELREALERLAEERDRFVAQLDEAEVGVKETTRAVFEGDGEAVEKRKGHRMRRNTARDAVEQIDLILPDLESELAQALAEENQQERERNAEQAKAFADGLVNVFSEVDQCLGEFRRAYTTCIATVREGRLRGWNLPSEELMQAKLNRALKTAFTVDELRGFDMTPLPAPQRCSFESIGRSYSEGIHGGALHMVKPPAPQPMPQAAKSNDDHKLPPKGDIDQRFRDDPKEFEIRIPTAR